MADPITSGEQPAEIAHLYGTVHAPGRPARATFCTRDESRVSMPVREALAAPLPARARDQLVKTLHLVEGTGWLHARRASRCPSCNPDGNPPAAPFATGYRAKTRRRTRR